MVFFNPKLLITEFNLLIKFFLNSINFEQDLNCNIASKSNIFIYHQFLINLTTPPLESLFHFVSVVNSNTFSINLVQKSFNLLVEFAYLIKDSYSYLLSLILLYIKLIYKSTRKYK